MSRTKLPWNKDNIKQLLKENDAAVARALIVLYDNQTYDEQQAKTTKHHNEIGFNAPDAKQLTKLAQKLKRTKKLSFMELNVVRAKILKYAGQLAKISNIKEQNRIEATQVRLEA